MLSDLNRRSTRVRLVKKDRILAVTSSPDGATVYVNGRKQKGVTPMKVVLKRGLATARTLRVGVRKSGSVSGYEAIPVKDAAWTDEGDALVVSVAISLERKPEQDERRAERQRARRERRRAKRRADRTSRATSTPGSPPTSTGKVAGAIATKTDDSAPDADEPSATNVDKDTSGSTPPRRDGSTVESPSVDGAGTAADPTADPDASGNNTPVNTTTEEVADVDSGSSPDKVKEDGKAKPDKAADNAKDKPTAPAKKPTPVEDEGPTPDWMK